MTGAGDLHARVAELVAEPGYGELFTRVRERVEAHGSPARITLQGLNPAARDALADLLGMRRRPNATTTVRLDDLDRSLRSSRVAAGLTEVLEAAGGPLRDQRAENRQHREAWEEVHEELAAAVAGRDPLATWLSGVRSDGLLARLGGTPAGGRRLGILAVEVLGRLPGDGLPLSVLAAEVTGDPHGLDPGTPLATLVLRGAAQLTGRPGLPNGARERRRLWSEVGVVCDPLSSSVLVLGLRATGSHLVAQTLGDHAAFGEPVRLTLRQLVDERLPYEPRLVSICENPAVMVAAADRLAEACAPLVCTEGMPDAAADRLLQDLRHAGCDLRFHADFDGGGIRIGNVVHQRFDATPWRMGVRDYEQALETSVVTTPIRSPVPDARWDSKLAPVIRGRCQIVSEEQVIDALLSDLGEQGAMGDRPTTPLLGPSA